LSQPPPACPERKVRPSFPGLRARRRRYSVSRRFGRTPGLFALLTGLVFFAWGEIYSLFPATCADSFGTKYAATNAALLFTAKGTMARR
jgi:hypothetical protein